MNGGPVRSVAVVGLGNIGGAIATRLVDAGQRVTGLDLDDERRRRFTDATGHVAVASFDDVELADISEILVVVRLTDHAAAVLDDLATRPLRADTTVYLVTTLELDFARALPSRTTPGYQLVELPVSGGEGGARRGELTLMAAGPLDDDRAEWLTATLGSVLVRFDVYGAPTLAKLLNNVTAAYNALAFAEMALLADRLGVEPTALQRLLATASGGSWMTDAFVDVVDDLLAKDVGLLADEVGELPTLSLADGDALIERLGAARRLLHPPPDDPSARATR